MCSLGREGCLIELPCNACPYPYAGSSNGMFSTVESQDSPTLVEAPTSSLDSCLTGIAAV
jgi:hypothetical protein